MKKILLLNQDWFADELRELGYEVVTAGHVFASHLEIKVEAPFIHIHKLIELIPNGWQPDVIVAHDNSAPFAFTGIEDIEVPTIFYSVDTHHHAALHRYLFDAFDYNMIAQKDYMPFMQETGHNPEWFPLWASRFVDASDEKKHGAVFVGTLDKKLNPERVVFFEELQKHISIVCTTGMFWEIFPFSEIVINQTVKSDLNFRVFESMMCGALLLTERSSNGLFDLFEDGKHLITYEKNNIIEAADKIRFYLENLELTRAIAKRGRDEILANHTSMARAKRLAQIIESIQKTDRSRRYPSMAVNYLCLARSSKNIDSKVRITGLTHSLRCFEKALETRQYFDETLAAQLVVATHDFDRQTTTKSGHLLLRKFFDHYPDSQVLLLAVIRSAMNNGEIPYAEELCRQHKFESSREAYEKADHIIVTLLNNM